MLGRVQGADLIILQELAVGGVNGISPLTLLGRFGTDLGARARSTPTVWRLQRTGFAPDWECIRNDMGEGSAVNPKLLTSIVAERPGRPTPPACRRGIVDTARRAGRGGAAFNSQCGAPLRPRRRSAEMRHFRIATGYAPLMQAGLSRLMPGSLAGRQMRCGEHGSHGAFQAKYCPPLAVIVEPVIRPASSEARNTTQRAISSGSPSRPIGICGRIRSLSTFSSMALTISVAM
jgi:hypothetical protein